MPGGKNAGGGEIWENEVLAFLKKRDILMLFYQIFVVITIIFGCIFNNNCQVISSFYTPQACIREFMVLFMLRRRRLGFLFFQLLTPWSVSKLI